MRWLIALALAFAAVAGCGDDDSTGASSGGGGGDQQLVVSAAASLTDALTACSKDFEGADVKLSFAGSDELAAQIRQGVKPDVYAAANTKLPDQLADEGLLETPVTFATNELVIAVPEDSDVSSIDDLAQPGVKLVIGSETVPVGAYTRDVLGGLPSDQEKKILANVRSNEPDVKGVVGKLTQGAADAGFVYRTDLVDGLKAVTLPEDLQPVVEYGAGVVKGAKQPELAQQYLDGLTDGACADALKSAGFGAP
ncbi:MAG TPA: molybdate ABC transporter substrate-binding protein [Solirubrobacteraceae bacterium]